MESMRLQWLQTFGAEGNVDALFSVLAEDPFVLESFEKIPFVTTPLHKAASEGKIHFVKEILNLKPSFAQKRDHFGRSPLHLALEGKHRQEGRSPLDSDLEEPCQEVVTWLIQHDSELVRVKAKGTITPLHYAAQQDDASNLADFLYVCPLSIEDLTVKRETAVHVALKNRSSKALKVLLGFLRRFNKEEILNWEDEEGNNALHTAVSTSQPEAVKLLIRYMNVNEENSIGLTALDIYDRQDRVDPEVKDILLAAKAKRATKFSCLRIRHPENSLVKYFSRGLSFTEKILKRLRLDYLHVSKIDLDVRNALLVVATLVATATYQGALSPPGGHWQDELNLQPGVRNSTTNTFNVVPSEEREAYMFLGSWGILVFLIFNSLAFLTSMYVILILTAGLPFLILWVSAVSLIASYTYAVYESFPYFEKKVVLPLLSFLLLASGTAAHYIPSFLSIQGKRLTGHGQRKNLRLGSFEKLKM